MADTEALRALVERLVTARRGSPALDAELALLWGWTSEKDEETTPKAKREQGEFDYYWTDPKGEGNGWAPPTFTLGMETADLYLNLESWPYKMSGNINGASKPYAIQACVELFSPYSGDRRSYRAFAFTPALAFCAAAVKAKFALEDDD